MKNMARRIIALGCVGILFTGMSGCEKQNGKENATKEEKIEYLLQEK